MLKTFRFLESFVDVTPTMYQRVFLTTLERLIDYQDRLLKYLRDQKKINNLQTKETTNIIVDYKKRVMKKLRSLETFSLHLTPDEPTFIDEYKYLNDRIIQNNEYLCEFNELFI